MPNNILALASSLSIQSSSVTYNITFTFSSLSIKVSGVAALQVLLAINKRDFDKMFDDIDNVSNSKKSMCGRLLLPSKRFGGAVTSAVISSVSVHRDRQHLFKSFQKCVSAFSTTKNHGQRFQTNLVQMYIMYLHKVLTTITVIHNKRQEMPTSSKDTVYSAPQTQYI